MSFALQKRARHFATVSRQLPKLSQMTKYDATGQRLARQFRSDELYTFPNVIAIFVGNIEIVYSVLSLTLRLYDAVKTGHTGTFVTSRQRDGSILPQRPVSY